MESEIAYHVYMYFIYKHTSHAKAFVPNVPWKQVSSQENITVETGEGWQQGPLAVEKSTKQTFSCATMEEWMLK